MLVAAKTFVRCTTLFPKKLMSCVKCDNWTLKPHISLKVAQRHLSNVETKKCSYDILNLMPATHFKKLGQVGNKRLEK